MFEFWTIPNNLPHKPDCFIVLSYAVEDKENPTRPTREIINLAYRWWRKHQNSCVIMSTGDNQKLGLPNSTVMKKYGVSIGIPKNKIIEEDRSKNTYENLIYSSDIVKQNKYHQITLVTYDLHTKRTLAVARRLGWKNFYWISSSSPGSPAYGIKRFQTYSRFTIFIYEILAYLYNLVRGELWIIN
jgi:uncharacterized SAM-binding protein YcdF (DUF218 family)